MIHVHIQIEVIWGAQKCRGLVTNIMEEIYQRGLGITRIIGIVGIIDIYKGFKGL